MYLVGSAATNVRTFEGNARFNHLRRLICTFEPLLPHPRMIAHAQHERRSTRLAMASSACGSSSSGGDGSGSRSSSGSSSGRVPSDVWKFFEKQKETKKAKCTLCCKELAFHGGTSNLRDHLLKVHPLSYRKPETRSRVQLGALDSFVKPRQCSEARSREITQRIAHMLALDLRPLRTVECDGFRELMAYLEPGYKVPSRPHVTSVLRHKHDLGKEQLRKKLQDEATSIALTTDIWTSAATEAYITVSAHYIPSTWKCCSCVLETKPFPERHTGQAIADKLVEIATAFAIDEKVSAIVHDQAANMELSLQILNSSKGWESLRCNAHCLQLCLKAGLSSNGISRLLGAGRKLVGHFKHSVVATEELKRRQVQMETGSKKLIQDCATRWNSSFYMLERLVEMRWPISAVLSDESVTKRSDRSLDLKSEQWTLAEELVKILRPFEVATTFFSYEENSSLSCILPVIFGLVEKLKESSEDCPAIRQFKQLMIADMKQRWELESLDTSSCLVMAAALDPRFKQLKFLNEFQIQAVKSEITERMDSFSRPAEPSSTGSTDGPPVKKRKTALDILLGEDDASSSHVSTTEELNQYMGEKPLQRDSAPLDWWKDNAHRYPRLASVAQGVLAIPATSTPSERIFSTAGLTVTKLRSCIKPENVDSLIFLNHNLKFLSTQ